MIRKGNTLGLVLWIFSLTISEAVLHLTTDQQWMEYKQLFGKIYPTPSDELYARYYYNYNLAMINTHNTYFNAKLRSYSLKPNQFTDMRLIHFNALFPKVTYPVVSNAKPNPPTGQAPAQFDPITQLGLQLVVEDQGTVCNSGWAYASAKSIEIMGAFQGITRNISPKRLSAQNLIDCAGGSRSCLNQVPQSAFDYLATYYQDLHFQSDYNNRKTDNSSGMCIPPVNSALVTVNLGEYSRIPDGDDETLKRIVAANLPVVVEVNPTSFDFMNYGSGVFDPPASRTAGSHFMVVLGYDTTTEGVDYWLLLNSFGPHWGENGFMKWKYDPSKPITKNAIFPSELA